MDFWNPKQQPLCITVNRIIKSIPIWQRKRDGPADFAISCLFLSFFLKRRYANSAYRCASIFSWLFSTLFDAVKTACRTQGYTERLRAMNYLLGGRLILFWWISKSSPRPRSISHGVIGDGEGSIRRQVFKEFPSSVRIVRLARNFLVMSSIDSHYQPSNDRVSATGEDVKLIAVHVEIFIIGIYFGISYTAIVWYRLMVVWWWAYGWLVFEINLHGLYCFRAFEGVNKGVRKQCLIAWNNSKIRCTFKEFIVRMLYIL